MERTEQPDDEKITIRYAETDEDVVAIHQFLLIVAKPQARAPIDPIASLMEVIRVTKEDVAIMAIRDGRLIGTLGLMRVAWWYNPQAYFMTERWQFVLEQFRCGEVNRMLEAEAESIADASDLEYIRQGKVRGKRGHLMLLPRSSRAESDMLETRG